MFGSALLDVIIGVVFIFLILSLIGTIVLEAVSNFLALRSWNLRRGIRRLFAEKLSTVQMLTSLVLFRFPNFNKRENPQTRAFFEHPAIQALGSRPSYIPDGIFSQVAAEIFDPAENLVDTRGYKVVSRLRRENPNAGDFDRALREWFNATMARSTGWYKRLTQVILLIFALIVVPLTGADAIAIANRLYRDAGLRTQLANEAQTQLERMPSASTHSSTAPAIASVGELWSEPLIGATTPAFDEEQRSGLWSVFGMLVTILAVSMGAPFWFSVLSKLTSLRSGAPAPSDDEKEGEKEKHAGQGTTGVDVTPGGVATAPVIFEPAEPGHHLGNSATLAELSAIVYQAEAQCLAAFKGKGFDGVFLEASDDRVDTQAVVGWNDEATVVVFRGTEGKAIKDWLTDARIATVQSPWYPGKVHSGFEEALQAVWPALALALAKHHKAGTPLWVGGHSLGGALATLAALRIARHGFETEPTHQGVRVAGLVTIGQPRVGLEDLADDLDQLLGAVYHRYINARDIVPRVPVYSMSYRHGGIARYITTGGKLLDEAPFWLRIIDGLLGDADKAADALKGTVADHSADKYVELLKQAARR